MNRVHQLSRKNQRIIIFYYFVSFLLLVPFWWNLTKLDRRPLPKKTILELQNEKILSYPLRLKWSGLLPVNEVQLTLTNLWKQAHPSPLSVNISAYQRELELQFFVSEANQSSSDQYTVFSTIQVQPLSKRPKKYSSASLVAQQNGVLTVYSNSEKEALPILSSFIEFYFEHLIHFPPRLPFAQTYELLFSYLFQALPTLPTHSYLEGVLPYLIPFLNTLLGQNNYKFTSHVQAFAPLRSGLTTTVQGSSLIPSHQVPHFVNPDWHIAPLSKSTVHLISYIPSSKLYILNEQEQKRHENDYIVPRWGSVTIINNEKQLVQVEQQSQLIVAHLRTLFGVTTLNRHTFKNHLFEFEQGTHGINTFELLLYQHQHILSSITIATETLSALIRLVEKQTRLPVPKYMEDITQHTCVLIRQSQLFESTSYKAALEARDRSEHAFLDPKMVGMVYFPDEHLYAIYLPLFLPLSVSFLKTVLQEWKLTQKEKKEKKENKENKEKKEKNT